MPESLSIFHFLSRVRSEDGGVVQTVLDLCQTVAENGHGIILATLDATDAPTTWCNASPRVPQLVKLDSPSWTSARLSGSSLAAVRHLVRQSDVVHLHTPWDPCNLQIAKIARQCGVPYIVTIHGMLDHYCMRQKTLKKKVYLALAGRRFLRNAETVHFTAEAERDQARDWVSGMNHTVIQPCAMDLAAYHTLPGPQPALRAFPQIRPEAKKLLFLSRVHPKKGVEFLIQAGALLRDRGHDIQLLIAGPGEGEYVKQLTSLSKSLNLDGQTEFLGMVRGTEKLSLYQVADVFVLPTHQENFGLVLPEAMACGAPVVTTRGTDIWRELQQAGAKIVSNAPEELASAMHEFLSDAQLRERVGRQGREFVMQWLRRENVTNGYLRMYRDTIKRGQSQQ